MEILPARLLRMIVAQPESAELSKVPLLLVRLPDTTGELASRLHESTKRDRLVAPAETTGVTLLAGTPLRSHSKVGGVYARTHRPSSTRTLRKELAKAPYFATMLVKRDARSAASRIHVGRSTKSDILLSDPSVSSVHAWLDCDEEGIYFVTDNSSRNGTWVEEDSLAAMTPTDVYAGDRLQFGAVKTLLCSVGELRAALK